MYILAHGSYHAILDEQLPPEPLRETLTELGVERYRRIDRFTQLSLLGSMRCLKNWQSRHEKSISVEANTSLYICSQMASVSNTAQVHEQLYRNRLPPKPVNFINTLSNSAGYYVARNLKLAGESHFISRSGAALEAGLQLAQLDLCSNSCDTLLLGRVDESPQPLAAHRLRLGLNTRAVLAEQSHWLMLGREPGHGKCSQIESIARTRDLQELQEWLLEYARPQHQLRTYGQLSEEQLGLLEQLKLLYTSGDATSGCANELQQFLSQQADTDEPKNLLVITATAHSPTLELLCVRG